MCFSLELHCKQTELGETTQQWAGREDNSNCPWASHGQNMVPSGTLLAIEHGPFIDYLRKKNMVIFHSEIAKDIPSDIISIISHM